MKGRPNIGYLGGVFDMFRVEHIDQLKAARKLCDLLIVGVHSDEIVLARTGKDPIIPFAERLEVVRAMREVDVAIGQMTNDAAEVWAQVRFGTLFLVPPHIVPADGVFADLADVGVDIVDLPSSRQSGSPLAGVV